MKSLSDNPVSIYGIVCFAAAIVCMFCNSATDLETGVLAGAGAVMFFAGLNEEK